MSIDPAPAAHPTPAVAVELTPDSRQDEHPVDAYLARLTSPASRRVQASALETIARRIAGEAERSPADHGLRYLVPWHQLTAAHTGRIRALLLEPNPVPADRWRRRR